MSVKGVLLDISGTLIIGNEVIQNGVKGLKRLREAKIPIRFISNTTKESKKTLVNRLNNLGLYARDSEVFTSLVAARNYVQSNNLRPFLILEDDAKQDFHDISTKDPNAVVIGLAPDKFDYENMDQAFQLILNGAKFIGIHKARYFKTSLDLSLGPGPFVAALEYATESKATVIGKPENSFFNMVCTELENDKPGYFYMIGDDVRDDIDGAQRAGLRGILVKTGKYRLDDELKIQPAPFAVAETFYDAVTLLLQQNSLP